MLYLYISVFSCKPANFYLYFIMCNFMQGCCVSIDSFDQENLCLDIWIDGWGEYQTGDHTHKKKIRERAANWGTLG